LPNGIDYPPEQLAEDIGETFARGLSHEQRRRQPFFNTSEEPKSQNENTRSN
jgi:hypothetical protein